MALVSCQAIGRHTAGLDFAAYARTSIGVRRGRAPAGINGKALRRAAVPEPALVDRVLEPRQIVGLRNRVIYGCDAVECDPVAVIAQREQERRVLPAKLLQPP